MHRCKAVNHVIAVNLQSIKAVKVSVSLSTRDCEHTEDVELFVLNLVLLFNLENVFLPKQIFYFLKTAPA